MRIIPSIVGPLVQLAPRECEVLKLLAHGDTNKVIAYKLGMKLSTVKWYIRQMLGSLAVANRVQLCLWAVSYPECIQGVAVKKVLVLPFEVAA